MKVLVLLNQKSGTLAASPTGDEADRIRRGFAARGIEADLRDVAGADLVGIVREAGGAYDAVIGGGGDGTLNAIANALTGSATPFGVLPLGTHNHFAKEMLVPLGLDAAVAALADALKTGAVRDLDVGQVNGHTFLNFSGLGLHPRLVKDRDAEHQALRRVKLLRRVLKKLLKLVALVIAFAKALTRLPVLQVRITGGGRTVRRVTPSVIVCNNAHQMKVFGVENVSYPDRCVLNVYVARSTGPAGLLRMLVASAFRRLHNVREFEAMCLTGLKIATRRRRLPVSIDGEVLDLRTPLEYSVKRGGLKVIAVEAKDDG